MAEHYTDDDVQAAVRILQQPRMHTNMSGDKHRADMRAVLDAVAPAIAARALREAHAEMKSLADHDEKGYPHKWGMWDAAEILHERADEIEGR